MSTAAYLCRHVSCGPIVPLWQLARQTESYDGDDITMMCQLDVLSRLLMTTRTPAHVHKLSFKK